MRIAPSLLAAVAALAFPAAALAVPPANDNYLASRADRVLAVPGSPWTPRRRRRRPIRTTRTVKGVAFSGGTQEPLACKGVGFGKTVWYDLCRRSPAACSCRGDRVRAVGRALRVDRKPEEPHARRLHDRRRRRAAARGQGREGVHRPDRRRGGCGRGAQLPRDVLPGRDEDDEFDQLDQCPTVAGTVDGCPPELKARAALTFDRVGSGARIASLYVDRVPKGAKVVAKCAGCGSQTITAKKTGRVSLSKLVGKTIASGRSVEIRVTMRKTGTGRTASAPPGSTSSNRDRTASSSARIAA